MHKNFFIYCAIIFTLLVSGCGIQENDTSNSKEAAIELGEEFIMELYTIEESNWGKVDDSPEKYVEEIRKQFSPYLIEKELDELVAKRFLMIPNEVADKHNVSISVGDIELKEYNRNKSESNSFDFEHSFTLLFTNQKGEEVEKLESNGQMTVINTDNGLKINRYHDSQIPIDMLEY